MLFCIIVFTVNLTENKISLYQAWSIPTEAGFAPPDLHLKLVINMWCGKGMEWKKMEGKGMN